MIYISSPNLSGNERAYVLDALDRNELSWRGAYVTRFEEAFAEFCGVEHAVSCSSGTAALHLALLALDIGPGDDVFLPSLSYIATANAVRYVGANPVFVDVEPLTWVIDPSEVERAIKKSKKPTAILPVHLYGVPAAMADLVDIANDYGVTIIEDAAEAHGASFEGRKVGGLGDVGAFSFFANKLLTTGEGGMLTTTNADIAERARLFRGQGQPAGRQFYHSVVGYNYRMTNIAAAIGLGQLEGFRTRLGEHDRIIAYYQRELRSLDWECQRVTHRAVAAPWLLSALVPNGGVERDIVICRLADVGIETRPVFPLISEMPPYDSVDLPVSSNVAKRGICLPTHAGLTDNDLKRILDELERAAR